MERHAMGRAESFIFEPADLVLVTVSSSLFAPKELWSDRFKYTGYMRWQSPENPELETTLTRFCGDEKVPILTFGSVTFDGARKVMTRFMRNWPDGKKIIIQSGWAGLTIERPRPEMLRVEKVSHDQLFRYGSLVIHHGGAGTTASVLHAGIPHVVIPHFGDQWFFASEVKRLRIGVEVKRSRWPEDLPKAVRLVEKGKALINAQKIAEMLKAENGPVAGVKELESLLAEH